MRSPASRNFRRNRRDQQTLTIRFDQRSIFSLSKSKGGEFRNHWFRSRQDFACWEAGPIPEWSEWSWTRASQFPSNFKIDREIPQEPPEASRARTIATISETQTQFKMNSNTGDLAERSHEQAEAAGRSARPDSKQFINSRVRKMIDQACQFPFRSSASFKASKVDRLWAFYKLEVTWTKHPTKSFRALNFGGGSVQKDPRSSLFRRIF